MPIETGMLPAGIPLPEDIAEQQQAAGPSQLFGNDQPAEPEQPAASAKLQECPACGANLTDKLDVTESEKARWLRHVLGEATFSLSYDVYGGTIVVLMEKPSPSTVAVLSEKFGVDKADVFAASLELEDAVTTASLVSVERANGPALYKRVEDREGNILAAETNKTAYLALQDDMRQVLRGLHRRFNATISELIRRCADPDFWQAAATAT